MASTPRFKIFDRDGEYQAATKRPEEAAAVVSLLGEGATIRNGHANNRTVWREGSEAQPAGESYDFVAKTVYERCSL